MQGIQTAVWNDDRKVRILIDGKDQKEVKRVQQIVYAVLTAIDDEDQSDIYTGSPVRE